MKVFAFAASMRKDSYNGRLIRLAVEIAQEAGAEVVLANFREFDMPLYDGDLEASEGLPTGAQKLAAHIESADAFLIASPEYNYSLPGTLKNAIDWVSRKKPVPFRGKSGLLLSASPSLIGGNRGLWQLRIPLEACGSYLHPDMFSLAQAHQAFEEDGRMKDAAAMARLEALIKTFLTWSEVHKQMAG